MVVDIGCLRSFMTIDKEVFEFWLATKMASHLKDKSKTHPGPEASHQLPKGDSFTCSNFVAGNIQKPRAEKLAASLDEL